jgi:hypothetical protein
VYLAVWNLMDSGQREKAHALIDRLLVTPSAAFGCFFSAGMGLLRSGDFDSRDLAKAAVCFERFRSLDDGQFHEGDTALAWYFPVYEH